MLAHLKRNHLKVKPELADVGAGFADGEDAAPGVGRSVGAWVPGGASCLHELIFD